MSSQPKIAKYAYKTLEYGRKHAMSRHEKV